MSNSNARIAAQVCASAVCDKLSPLLAIQHDRKWFDLGIDHCVDRLHDECLRFERDGWSESEEELYLHLFDSMSLLVMTRAHGKNALELATRALAKLTPLAGPFGPIGKAPRARKAVR